MEPSRGTSPGQTHAGEPTPPGRTLIDWLAILLFALLGLPFLYLCASLIYEAITQARVRDRAEVIFAAAVCGGLPGAVCWWRVWRIYFGRQRIWRRSMRGRRRLCIRCGYDLRGGVEICPECGMPVPEPIARIAARLEAMTGQVRKNQTDSDDAPRL